MLETGKISGWKHLLLFVLFLSLFLSAYFIFVLMGGILGVFSPLPLPDDLPVGTLFHSDPCAVFVLDAGHGGMDSGAVATDGTCEKNINLALTQRIGEYLEAAGARVVYSRDSDVLLETPGAPTKKSGDVMARVRKAKENPDAVFVSIHMNKFPQEQYKGLQVFYSPNHVRSTKIAVALQQHVVENLQPENNRAAKKAGSEIFVLDRIPTPAILVECGFLSNREELSLLKNEGYQSSLAFVIAHSLLQSATEDS